MTEHDAFWSRVDRSDVDGCWPWTGAQSRGYGYLSWGGRSMRAHRVAWLLSRGPIPDGHGVLHHCDNPPCCRPAHLFTGTQSDNMGDAAAKGRMNVSRRIPPADAHDVEMIRRLVAIRVAPADIARRLRLKPRTVHEVIHSLVQRS